MRGSRGVTLFELILVIVVIAIGASAAMPYFGKSVENSKMKAVESSVRYLRDAVMFYARDRGGAMPVLSSDNDPHFLKRLFDTQYLVPADLAFYKDLGTGIVANYSVQPFLNDIDPLPALPPLQPGNRVAPQALFKVCGSLDATFARFFCIYQCNVGARESTVTGSDSCPS